MQRLACKPPRSALVLSPLAASLAGCEGQQSALSAAGPDAAAVALLGYIMFVGGAVIFAVVMGLLAYGIMAPPSWRAWRGQRFFIVGGGFGFPVITLGILLTYSFLLLRDEDRGEVGRSAGLSHGNPQLGIEVVGEQWWWRVRYLDEDGNLDFETANEIRMPTGRRVAFSLTSADVIHAFWVPSLGGKIDMIPGRTTTLTLQADREGVYRGQCAEFCGLQHAKMAFYVIAEAPDRFEQWLASQRRPPDEPVDPFLTRGLDVFLSSGCGACHTIRGTAADGRIGPDLTKVGSRHSLAAGTLPNNTGTLAGWISSSQHLKPGNFMPSFDVLTGPDLRALAAYLDSLK